jgi:hypothetical protein
VEFEVEEITKKEVDDANKKDIQKAIIDGFNQMIQLAQKVLELEKRVVVLEQQNTGIEGISLV